MTEKKKIPGVVDRVEGKTVVVVIRDPNDPGSTREVYVDSGNLKKTDLKEGDKVTVEMCRMPTEESTKTVSLVFRGAQPDEMAKRFFSYLVDGGLEDHLIQELSGKGLNLEICGCDNKELIVDFQCSKDGTTDTPLSKKRGNG